MNTAINHLRQSAQSAVPTASASRHRIHISSPHIFESARCLAPEDARAVKWLAGYCRILDRTGDSFQTELGLDAIQIRDCLTDPDCDPTLRATFTGAVTLLREQWEQRLAAPYCNPQSEIPNPQFPPNPFPHQTPFHQALGKVARTQPVTVTRKAVEFAEAGGWAVTEGLERMGKTVAGAHCFLHRLGTAAWCRVPSGDGLRSFLFSLARAVGVASHNATEDATRLKARIATVLGPGKIETLFLDQFHAILPINPHRVYPARLELLMDFVDELGVNIVGIATPQWGNQLAALGENARYRVGQAIGRIERFRLRETLTDAELIAIAKSREPDLPDQACQLLAVHARTSKGYCGTLMNTLARYRQRLAASPRADATQAVALAINEEEQLVKGGSTK